MKKIKEVNVKCGRFGCVWSKGKKCEKDRVVLDTDGLCKSYESIEKMMVQIPSFKEGNHEGRQKDAS